MDGVTLFLTTGYTMTFTMKGHTGRYYNGRWEEQNENRTKPNSVAGATRHG